MGFAWLEGASGKRCSSRKFVSEAARRSFRSVVKGLGCLNPRMESSRKGDPCPFVGVGGGPDARANVHDAVQL